MTILSPAQIAGYARAAGLTDRDNLAVAVAVAQAESSGNTLAHNSKGLDDSYGLWQINMRGSMGPDRRAKLGIAADVALLDPAVNARAMMLVSNGGKAWHKWTTFTAGKYLLYLGPARAAAVAALGGEAAPVTDTGGGGLVAAPAGLTDLLTAPVDVAVSAARATEMLAKAGVWMADRHNWARLVYVGYGGVLLVAALLIAGRKPIGKTLSVAAGVAPAGKVAKGLGKAAKVAG